MSASPPAAPAAPSRPATQPQAGGCLRPGVFLLVLIGAAGIHAFRKGDFLPTEPAGRTVIEITGSPGQDEMKAHVARMTSGEILRHAFASAKSPDQLRVNVEVEAKGRFITITTYGNDLNATVLATAFEDDLRSQHDEARRRPHQAMEAQLVSAQATTETARLNWMDLMKKYQISPDGHSPADEAGAQEISSRLAKSKADLVAANLLSTVMKEHDIDKAAAALIASPSADAAVKSKCQTYFEWKTSAAAPGAPPDAAATLKSTRDKMGPLLDYYRMQCDASVQSLRNQISTYEAALQDFDKAAMARLNRQSEVESARVNYDLQKALVKSLKEDLLQRSVKESVLQTYIRVVEEARNIEVPHRFARKVAHFAAVASAVLLVALLLSAFAGRLCRRAS